GFAEALTALLIDLEFLEGKTALIGIYGVLSDFRLVRELSPPADDTVQQIAHVLDREAHNLGRWDRDQQPEFFCQQVCMAAVVVGATALVEAARRRLQVQGT